MTDVSGECAVVIPFFQRKTGVLARALASVFAQSYTDFFVIIVDDASPISAKSELSAMPAQWLSKIKVIEQENRGPGGARNRALDSIQDGVSFAAFLDSDDVWMPHHLERSITLMKSENADCSWETMAPDDDFDPYLPPSSFSQPSLLDPVADVPGAFRIAKLSRFLMYKWWHFLHLSATVISRDVFETVRFDERYRIAVEDFMFFYACSQVARRCVISDAIGASRGTGSNLYHGTQFASSKAVHQLYLSMTALAHVQKGPLFDLRDQAAMKSWRKDTREHAIRNMVSGLRRGHFDIVPLAARWLKADPKIMGSFLQMMLRLSLHGRGGRKAVEARPGTRKPADS